jgi:hypothetical protein
MCLYVDLIKIRCVNVRMMLNRIRNVSRCARNEHISRRSMDSTASRGVHHQTLTIDRDCRINGPPDILEDR